MMKTGLSKLTKHFLKQGETGQSMVILAFAFIVLLAFAGIATDISILFVRFNTLSRAVDSAAIAAAGQMRQDRNLATVSLAARQFIEFHGLDPRDVIVETCLTSPAPDDDGDGVPDDPELCTQEQRKLVRVIAQVNSPTVFLRLLGFANILLEASAISETAVLDVVLIMDVSESMLNDTSYQDWADIGQGKVYVPPHYANILTDRGDPVGGAEQVNLWRTEFLSVPQERVNLRLVYSDGSDNRSATKASYDPGGTEPTYPVLVKTPFAGTHDPPRPECRVRFYPYSLASGPSSELLTTYYGSDWNDPLGDGRWGGFVPAYDFYGCCNDPGDGTVAQDGTITPGASQESDQNFSDLVCQPFKQARDATRQFLERMDFVRGDRVAYVTFDRTAFIIDPDGTGPATHMLETFPDAVNVLNRDVGVRAEPNFYDWAETGGGWISFAAGIDAVSNPATISVPIDYYDVNFIPAAEYNDYPAQGSCPFQNAALPWWASIHSGDLFAGDDITPALERIQTPNPTNPVWSSFTLDVRHSYELWASCRGTNVGAALREANNAILDPRTIRREGTVWTMVLIGDGAAGASDPVRRNVGGNIKKLREADPYNKNIATGDPEPLPSEYGVYGVCPFGTPSNLSGPGPGELVLTGDDISREGQVAFPFCSDEDPESRHFCDMTPGTEDEDYNFGLTPDQNAELGNITDIVLANSEFPQCEFDYDVDDYSRDWADFVALQDPGAVIEAQLPTIFTIGFGLDFPVGDGSCGANVPDCLGEELLRYISDVGDNNRIDIDFQQDMVDDEDPTLDGTLSAGETFGFRGVCEESTPNPISDVYPDPLVMVNRLPPRENCGNYFNAPDQAELELVFDEIASRMFTRLAG